MERWRDEVGEVWERRGRGMDDYSFLLFLSFPLLSIPLSSHTLSDVLDMLLASTIPFPLDLSHFPQLVSIGQFTPAVGYRFASSRLNCEYKAAHLCTLFPISISISI